MKLGRLFHHSFKLTPKIYKGFKDTFLDKNPIHTNQNFATKFGFKKRVMYGNILNGFLSYFVGECLPEKNVVILSQSINFLKPVYLNDTLNLDVVVVNQSKAVSVIEFTFQFHNQKSEKVASGKIQIKTLKRKS